MVNILAENKTLFTHFVLNIFIHLPNSLMLITGFLTILKLI